MDSAIDGRLAIIFTHKGDSEYLWYCLENAKQNCPDCRLVLLGDEANDKCGSLAEHYLISDYSATADNFELLYRHQSTNPYWYELFCFQRWFIICDFVKKNGIDNFFCCDSDILIFDDLSHYVPKHDAFSLTVANKEGPQCSFFTQEKLTHFCNYIEEQYTSLQGLKRLLDRYTLFRSNNWHGGNCDMTMFTFFEKDFPGSVLDYGFEDKKDSLVYSCQLAQDWMIRHKKKGLPIAKILWADHKPYIIAKSGERFLVPVIHFQGDYKILMYSYSTFPYSKRRKIRKRFFKQRFLKSIKKICTCVFPYRFVIFLQKHFA